MKHQSLLLGLVGLAVMVTIAGCSDSDPDNKDSASGGTSSVGGSSSKSSGSSEAGQGGKSGEFSGQGGSSGGQGGAGGSSVASSTAENPCADGVGDFGGKNAADLFSMNTVPTFDLHLPADAWEKLKAEATKEEYVEASACFEGKLIGKVGLRFKGSYGSLYTCFNEKGENICRKLGMKIKFNEYVPGQVFYGLKRINFQGYRWDDSYMRERLSYDLYREMGVTAPRASWAKLRVNGEDQGLFGMVEQIDGKFAKDRWPDNAEGNVFKEVWPDQANEDWMKSHLETNEDVADVSAYMAFSSALNSAPEDSIRSTLGNYLDLDYLARYMAVDDAIANFDGVTTFYTDGDPNLAGNHNYYFYQESNNRFTIIPWDLEATLNLSSKFGFVPEWQKKPEDCSLTYAVWGGDNQVIAPGCNRVFRGLAADLTAYKAATQQLLEGAFTPERMNAAIDKHAALIRDAAKADPNGAGLDAFNSAIGYIKRDVLGLRRRLQHIVSGEPTNPLELDLTQSYGFETDDSYGAFVGGGLMCNSTSTADVAINTDTPISETKSLRILFNFGNEVKGWNQWMQYGTPLAKVPTDFTKYTGVKFKVRSDKPRQLRVDIDSPNNPAIALGVQRGWIASIETTEVEEVSFNFADAEIPDWAADPGDDLTKILQTASGFVFKPQCAGRNAKGQLATGTTDDGWVDIDDIELF